MFLLFNCKVIVVDITTGLVQMVHFLQSQVTERFILREAKSNVILPRPITDTMLCFGIIPSLQLAFLLHWARRETENGQFRIQVGPMTKVIRSEGLIKFLRVVSNRQTCIEFTPTSACSPASLSRSPNQPCRSLSKLILRSTSDLERPRSCLLQADVSCRAEITPRDAKACYGLELETLFSPLGSTRERSPTPFFCQLSEITSHQSD